MEIDFEVSMASRSREELQALLAAGDQYTPEARAAAQRELATRTSEPVEPPARDYVAHSPIDRMIVRLAALREWPSRLLPENLPRRLRTLFWGSVWAIIPGCFAVFQGSLTKTDVFFIVLAAAGALLAFTIITERVYSRWLAVLMIIGFATSALIDNVRTGHYDLGIPIAAVGMLLYLRRDPEAEEYFRGLR